MRIYVYEFHGHFKTSCLKSATSQPPAFNLCVTTSSRISNINITEEYIILILRHHHPAILSFAITGTRHFFQGMVTDRVRHRRSASFRGLYEPRNSVQICPRLAGRPAGSKVQKCTQRWGPVTHAMSNGRYPRAVKDCPRT